MRFRPAMLVAIAAITAAAACAPSDDSSDAAQTAEPDEAAQAGIDQAPAAMPAGDLTLTSTTFDANQPIPLRNSAYGESVSPELSWSNLPEGTQSLAIVLEDPDAPMAEPFIHWVIYNIPATANGLPEGLPTDSVLTAPAEIAGTTQGVNGTRQTGYFGPRPPAGPVHNYNFVLYALSAPPELPSGLNAAELREAFGDNVLAETRLIGTYQQAQ